MLVEACKEVDDAIEFSVAKSDEPIRVKHLLHLYLTIILAKLEQFQT